MAEASKLKIDCSNIYNNYKIIYQNMLRPYSTKKVGKTQFKYAFSLGNVNNNSNFRRKNKMIKNESFLPSLNNINRSVSIARQNDSKESIRKKNVTFELEKLYEQNIGHKNTIKKLQTDIDLLKNDLNQKQTVLNSLNKKIDKLIDEKEKENEVNIEMTEPTQVQGKYIMIKKMKNKIMEAENYLNKKRYNNKLIKKNIRYTKSIEFEMEQNIVNEQMKKIMKLIENSKDLKKQQEEEIMENKVYNKRIKTQAKLIKTFEQKLKELKEEEKYLQNEIQKYENTLNASNENVNSIKLKHITLKEQNVKLSQEKLEFDNKNKECTLEILQKQLNRAKNDYNFYKSKYDDTEKRLDIIKKNSLEQSIQPSNKSKTEKIINKVKDIYKQNKDKENDLEKYLFLYQEAIEKLNKGEKVNIKEIKDKILEIINRKIEDFNINDLKKGKKKRKGKVSKKIIFDELTLAENNPYYINAKENDSLKTNKFNNEQYSQFGYALFTNFESKKINQEKAKDDIAIPLINFYKEIDPNKENPENQENKDNSANKESNLQGQLCDKFIELISNELNCNNEDDLKRLKIYFNAVYFERSKNIKNKDNNSSNVDLFTDYFLSLFQYLHEYTQKEENKFKRKLNTKYKEYLLKLNELINKNDNKKVIKVIIKDSNSNPVATKDNKENKDNKDNEDNKENKDNTDNKENKDKKDSTDNIDNKDNKDNNVKKDNKDNKDKKDKKDNTENKITYITIQEIRNIFNNNKDIKLKDTYIEYIIYFLKQFDDDTSSLFDLKVEKLDEIMKYEIIINEASTNLNENENNDINPNSNENNINDLLNSNNLNNDKDFRDNESIASLDPITQDDFNANIDHVLKIVKQLMFEEKKDLRTLFADSIVKITSPDTDIITLDSFRNELNKRNVNINIVRLVCLKTKYCVNEELKALDLKKIEEDINKLNENFNNNYI